MQSLIGLKGRCRSYKVDGAGEGEGPKLDHICKDMGNSNMYELHLSMAADVTRVEFAVSLTQSSANLHYICHIKSSCASSLFKCTCFSPIFSV